MGQAAALVAHSAGYLQTLVLATLASSLLYIGGVTKKILTSIPQIYPCRAALAQPTRLRSHSRKTTLVSYTVIARTQKATPTRPQMGAWSKLGSRPAEDIKVSRELCNPWHLHSRWVSMPPSRWQEERSPSNRDRQLAVRPRDLQGRLCIPIW